MRARKQRLEPDMEPGDSQYKREDDPHGGQPSTDRGRLGSCRHPSELLSASTVRFDRVGSLLRTSPDSMLEPWRSRQSSSSMSRATSSRSITARIRDSNDFAGKRARHENGRQENARRNDADALRFSASLEHPLVEFDAIRGVNDPAIRVIAQRVESVQANQLRRSFYCFFRDQLPIRSSADHDPLVRLAYAAITHDDREARRSGRSGTKQIARLDHRHKVGIEPIDSDAPNPGRCLFCQLDQSEIMRLALENAEVGDHKQGVVREENGQGGKSFFPATRMGSLPGDFRQHSAVSGEDRVRRKRVTTACRRTPPKPLRQAVG